eukprot:Nk52_evm58s32 gene=Nk52_evmTU58s32
MDPQQQQEEAERGNDTSHNNENAFDVAIYGTGLVESILAGALARIGKRIIHVDCKDYYGEAAGSVTADFFFTPATVAAFRVEVAEKSIVAGDLERKRKQEQEEEEGGRDSSVYVPRIFLLKGVYFDLTPKLLFSRSHFVDYMNKSGTSRYVQFKPLDKLFMCCEKFVQEQKNNNSNKESATKRKNEERDASSLEESSSLGSSVPCSFLRPVPSSRSDVFANRDINVIEKRLLMRFLTFCADYNIEESRYSFLNVKMKKNMNRGVVVDEARGDGEGEEGKEKSGGKDRRGGEKITASVVENEWAGKPFSEFLLKCFKIKGRLFEYIVYCIALTIHGEEEADSSLSSSSPSSPSSLGLFYDYINVNTKTGIELVQRYLFSVGRFGVVNNAAMLCPMYGSGEIPQAFCRMAAVYGSVYVLNAEITRLVVSGEVDSSANSSRGDGEEYRPLSVTGFDMEEEGMKDFSCSHLICSSEGKMNLVQNCVNFESYARDGTGVKNKYSGAELLKAKSWVSRCVVVCEGSLTGENELSLGSIVPGTFGNKYAITVHQTGAKVGVVPDSKEHLRIVHFTMKASSDTVSAREDLEKCVQSMFYYADEVKNEGADLNVEESRNKAVFCAFFTIHRYEERDSLKADPRMNLLHGNNVTWCDPAEYSVDYENVIEEAKSKYVTVMKSLGYGGDDMPEFIPQVPDTEEVPHEDSSDDEKEKEETEQNSGAKAEEDEKSGSDNRANEAEENK